MTNTPSHTTSNSEQEDNPMSAKMSLRDSLIAAKALIPPDKWARGNGHLLGNVPHDKECALTACHKVGWGYGLYPAMVKALEAQIPPKSRQRALHKFNDSSSYADVAALFDRAIEAAPVTP